MSFYTALTGLNGAQSDISATSNNIANVGTTGFKRSRAEFGDIFATSPLQNSSSSIGSGAILKGIKQQFTQGNIASSLNALDLAISGQGFFALKPSLTSSQTVYTRNGSFNVDNDRYVVDSSGQYLLTYPVNTDGSVTAKDLDSAVPLKLPVTSGDPNATSNIRLGVNVPADAPVVTNLPKFANGYVFDPSDAESYTNSTSITIFDDLGNPTIATIYFIKTQNASASDPTNKYDTRLVIDDTVIDPNLVAAVNDNGKQIFVDRFGNQTTQVPDDNYFLEGKGAPLYKLDDLRTKVNSQPASIQGEQAGFDFGEEGDKLIEIVTDPLMFPATEEGGNTNSGVFWGKDFLLVNVDDSDAPVSINLRPGKYNATQLAAEVERAINEAYGDDKKFQIVQNVDDELTIDLFKLGTDGSPVSLGENRITVDLLKETSVSELAGIAIDGASPDFTKDEFLVHVQQRINATLNDYIDPTGNNGAATLGLDGRLFTRAVGEKISTPPSAPAIIQLDHNVGTAGITAASETKFLAYSNFGNKPSLSVFDGSIPLTTANGTNTLTYDPTQNKITLYVKSADYDPKSATIQLQGPTTGQFGALLNGRTLRLIDSAGVTEGIYTKIQIDASGLALSETGFSYGSSDGAINLLFNPSSDVEAFFEGAKNGTEGVVTTFNSSKIVLREIGTDANRKTSDTSYEHAFVISNFDQRVALAAPVNANKLSYDPLKKEITLLVPKASYNPESATVQLRGPTNGQFGTSLNGRTLQLINSNGVTVTDSSVTPAVDYTQIKIDASGLNLPATAFVFGNNDAAISLLFNPSSGTKQSAVSSLGLTNFVYDGTSTTTIANSETRINLVNKLNWVDETNPAIKVSYDGVNQRLQFSVDRTILGTGTGSNFNSFTVYGSSDAQDTNNLGIPDSGNATQVLIRGGEILSAESFVADGEEIQLNDKRYGVTVGYKSDTKSFVINSGTTGENIAENGAIGVSNSQKASNIQIGRRTLNSDGTVDASEVINLENRIIGGGENSVLGFGVTKSDYLFNAGRGLAAQSAIATGRAAQGDLTNVFRLTGNGGENIFNISVNGISGVIEIPAGNYVGTTLATALEERINQISDPVTGEGVGGVTVRYSAATNSFTFITGTTGDASTIKVKGTSRLGLDDVPLGVGAIPKIYNLVQAKNADGVALYVDPDGNVVTTPPENMVSGYYPLYIDEGELTFDKTGKLVSPKNMVSFEQQGDGFSISLAVDFSASTQYAQPFSVLSVEQDGFTSGRLDGLEIDSAGTIRANYTNGQNNPLGKIVVASFNNQNGLKQVGNATYVETAVSGSPQVGEAGSEGFGSVQSGSLERSNVDITEELVNLITAQRNFQAAAKAIETTTTLTQTIINIRM
ncbi:Flagellar hook-basal body protein, FlgE/F/G [Paracoccaceae bacterium]